MFKMLGVINIALIIMVIVLGAISNKYIKMVNESTRIVGKGTKNNSLYYRKINLYKLNSSISFIISIILSVTIFSL